MASISSSASSTISCRSNDRQYLAVGAGRTQEEIAKFSVHDAEQYARYDARLEAVADVLRALVLETPPNLTEGWLAAIPEMLKAASVGRRLSSSSI